MNNKPKISIIVPIYNVEKYLSKCIKSILNQTFTNFELILVNDGSTDKSYKIAQLFQRQDKRIKLYSKENGGLSDTRNYGIEHAIGDYLVFIDSDDYVANNYLEILYTGIEKNNVDVAICGIKKVNEFGNTLEILHTENDDEVISGKKLLENTFLGIDNITSIVAWNKIYAKELFDNLKYPKGKIYEDEALMVPLFLKTNKIIFLDFPLYYYVERKDSITTSTFNSQKLYDTLDFNEKRLTILKYKDNHLYKLAVNKYKNNLLYLYGNYRETMSIKEEKIIQNKYRELVKKHFGSSPKLVLKDIFAFINIKIIYRLGKNK